MDPAKRTFYLGRYNCIEQIGAGPIGETYRAKIYGVAGFEKQFAVKRLHPQFGADEAFVGRFVQAASAFAALEHDGIARAYEVNAQGAQLYMVVDLVRGLDVRRLLDALQQRGEALAPDAAMTLAIDIAEALEYAHGRTNVLPGGVLHLGLTAASVMVTYDGRVKLLDVGLLRPLIRSGWSGDDALALTLAYLAPEEWRSEALDARADVFSLGVVLCELLSGTRTFVSDRAADLLATIEAGPPQVPPADPRLRDVVTRALQPDRAKRFDTVADMRTAIQTILGGRAERARADLSAVVRRVAMPRERRTGAFAAVTLPPAAIGMSTAFGGGKATAAAATVAPWAPPPSMPAGSTVPAIPPSNTQRGIGPTAEAIELNAVPAAAKEASHGRAAKVVGKAELGAADAQWAALASELDTVESGATAADATAQEAASASPPNGEAGPRAMPPPPPRSRAAEVAAAANGSDGEASWSQPPLKPAPHSPEPAFASPAAEPPARVEPARSSVPGATLPAKSGRGRTMLGTFGLVAAAGALAVYAGLSGNERPSESGAAPTMAAKATESAARPQATGATVAREADNRGGAALTAVATTTSAARAESVNAEPRKTQPANAEPAIAPPPIATPANARPANGAAFEVDSAPAGALVFVDGEDKGVTPARLDVAPGAHKLVVAAEGQKLVQREIHVTPGGHVELTLEPAKLPPNVAGDAGLKVRCKSHGELRIFVDGVDSGRSCPNEERISVVAGPHKIGLLSPRTGEMHELDHEVAEGNYSTRVYVRY